MPGGHGMTGGFCDIIVQDNDGQPYLLIECKTADGDKSKEFSRAWAKMQKDGGQLFNYYNSYRQAQWLCLYACGFVNNQAESAYRLISMKDNDEYLGSNEKLLSFKKVQDEFNRTRMKIEEYRTKIANIFNDLEIIQEGVKWFKISELGNILMCRRIMKHETNSMGGVPFYKIGTFGGEANAFIPLELYNNYKEKYPYPKKGQVLISAAGTLGKVVIFDGKPAYFQDSNIVWINSNEEVVMNKFLYYSLRQVNWKKYATEGSVISRIYNEDLRNIEILVPSLEAQQSIIAQINGYEAEIAACEQKIQSLPAQKQAVLARYLN